MLTLEEVNRHVKKSNSVCFDLLQDDPCHWRSAMERSGAIAPGRQGLRGASAEVEIIFINLRWASHKV